ncbi:hypothetical protein [Nocardia sp. NPDC051570]|uniref:hypothetical protein n=1 Tax=Nocardia sp. NPDC051570 TaxID=3364324 RepID=UPI0037BDF89E
MTARVGAVHLGWDVVSVAAGGGGTPIRPVQVEGTYTPPAYLLADASGRLHTSGVERQRPDLGIAISDVRDVLGHQQIRVAGATWPVELVLRARLYNPLAAVGKYLRGKPDVVALPYPDDWPDERVDEYCRLVELLDVVTEPLPESVALSGYVRALGLVHPPEAGRRPVGATGVYSDGRICLVVAVHGDDEQPTESVGVPIAPDAMREAQSADNVVIEVMAAARLIGADTSTVLLTGNVCFNDALRLAFQNHLGHRLRVADHPMHALVLGAAHLLVSDSEATDGEYPSGPGAPPDPRGPQGNSGPNPGPPHGMTGPQVNPGSGQGGSAAPGNTGSQPLASPPGAGSADSAGSGQGGVGPSGNSGPGHGVSDMLGPGPTNRTTGPGATDTGRHALPAIGMATSEQQSGRHSWRPPESASAEATRQLGGMRPVDQGPRHIVPHAQPPHRQPEPLTRQPEMVPRQPDSPPVEGRHAARETTYPTAEEPTTRVVRTPGTALGDHGSRFTRPPGAADEVTVVTGHRSESAGPRAAAGWTPPTASEHDDEEGDQRRGRLWNKVKDNLFGAPAIVGAVALAAVALHSGGEPEHQSRPADAVAPIDTGTGVDAVAPAAAGTVDTFDVRSVDTRSDFGAWPAIEQAGRIPPTIPECALTPYTHPGAGPQAIDEHGCAQLGLDNLRYLVPTLPAIIDPGPPMHI